MYSLLFCVHSLNTKPVYSGFMTLCAWLSDEPNRFFEKVHLDTFLNISAVWLQQIVSPGTPKTFLSYIPKKDFREKLCLDSPMINIINHEKQRGRRYQGLWWHLQAHWRMGSIPGKGVVLKNCLSWKHPYSTQYLITLGFFPFNFFLGYVYLSPILTMFPPPHWCSGSILTTICRQVGNK